MDNFVKGEKVIHKSLGKGIFVRYDLHDGDAVVDFTDKLGDTAEMCVSVLRLSRAEQSITQVERHTGVVKWFNDVQGVGFIEVEGWDEDVFAHFSHITTEGYQTLYAGEIVEFELDKGNHGLRAVNIARLTRKTVKFVPETVVIEETTVISIIENRIKQAKTDMVDAQSDMAYERAKGAKQELESLLNEIKHISLKGVD